MQEKKVGALAACIGKYKKKDTYTWADREPWQKGSAVFSMRSKSLSKMVEEEAFEPGGGMHGRGAHTHRGRGAFLALQQDSLRTIY